VRGVGVDMRKWKTAAAAFAVASGIAGGASAATVYHSTVSGENDPFPDPLLGSMALAKCDDGGGTETVCGTWEDGGATGDYSKAFGLTYATSKTFDWSYDPTKVTGADPVLYPTYLAVKGGGGGASGGGYVIYSITPGDTLGSVLDFASYIDKDISHVSFYDGTAAVPLPAAGWMLLAGVGGLAAMRRRKKA